MSAQPREDDAPTDGALIVTARTVCHRVIATEPGAMVGYYCPLCQRTRPRAAVERSEPHDWRCKDAHDCVAARSRRMAGATPNATTETRSER